MAAVFHNIFPKFVELPILQTMSGKKRKMKTAWKVLLWIAGIWAVLLIVIQIALSPAVLTRLANKYANKYIDGDVAFGEVKMSVFKSFPYLNVGFSDVSVTYPSDRFNFPDENFYSRQGKGETADTLASFKNLYASIDVAALAFGTVKVPGIMLNSPRIFAKSYPDGRANWEIFKTSSDSTDTGTAAEDTAESQMPKIVLGRIMLRNNPHIVYSSPEDTVFAMLTLKKLRFNGRLATGRNGRNRVTLAKPVTETSWQEVAINTFMDILSKHNIPLDKEISEKLKDKLQNPKDDIPKEALFTVADMLTQTYNPLHHQGVMKSKMLLAVSLAKRFDLSKDDIDKLRIAMLLYDIGNLMIPAELLQKTTPLTEEERNHIKEHPIIAAREILKPITYIQDIIPIIEHHHENWDGTGYPSKIAKEEIPMTSQIILIVDAYYALIEPRTYRAELTPKQAVEIIKQDAGKKWNSALVQEFISLIDHDI